MNEPMLKIACPDVHPHGDVTISLDGHDLTHGVRSLRLNMEVGVLNSVTMEIMPSLVDVDARVLASLVDVEAPDAPPFDQDARAS